MAVDRDITHFSRHCGGGSVAESRMYREEQYLAPCYSEQCDKQGVIPVIYEANETGFFDQSHFTQQFKQHNLMTPASYRKTTRFF
jgi:AraC-like DNA-binding protein